MRDATLFFVATALGTALAMPAAVFGLPIAAAGIAGLAYRGRAILAAAAAGTGVGMAAVLAPSAILYAAPIALAIVFAVVLLPKRPVQLVAGALIGVFALTSAGYDAFAWNDRAILRAPNFLSASAAAEGAPKPVAVQTRFKVLSFFSVRKTAASSPFLTSVSFFMMMMSPSWISASIIESPLAIRANRSSVSLTRLRAIWSGHRRCAAHPRPGSAPARRRR